MHNDMTIPVRVAALRAETANILRVEVESTRRGVIAAF